MKAITKKHKLNIGKEEEVNGLKPEILKYIAWINGKGTKKGTLFSAITTWAYIC